MTSDETGSNPEAEIIEKGSRLETEKDGKVTQREEVDVRMIPRWQKKLKEMFRKKTKNDQGSN